MAEAISSPIERHPGPGWVCDLPPVIGPAIWRFFAHAVSHGHCRTATALWRGLQLLGRAQLRFRAMAAPGRQRQSLPLIGRVVRCGGGHLTDANDAIHAGDREGIAADTQQDHDVFG